MGNIRQGRDALWLGRHFGQAAGKAFEGFCRSDKQGGLHRVFGKAFWQGLTI